MLDDPKTIREVNLKLDGIQATLNSNVTWLRAGIAGCFGLIVAVAGGGFTLFHEIGSVDSKVSGLDATMKSALGRMERLDTSLSNMPQIQARFEQAATRVENAIKSQSDQIAAIRPLPAIGLTSNQYGALRIAFKLERKGHQPPKYSRRYHSGRTTKIASRFRLSKDSAKSKRNEILNRRQRLTNNRNFKRRCRYCCRACIKADGIATRPIPAKAAAITAPNVVYTAASAERRPIAPPSKPTYAAAEEPRKIAIKTFPAVVVIVHLHTKYIVI